MHLFRKMAALLLAVILTAGAFCLVSHGAVGTVGADGALDFGEAYEKIVSALAAGEPVYDENRGKWMLTVDVSAYALPLSELKSVCGAAFYQNPQFFFWTGGYSYSYSGGVVMKVYIPYEYAPEELSERRARFGEMTEALFALCPEDATPLETVLFYHDYLASNYEYDVTYEINDAYRFLAEKKGVCQSYTAVFTLLMNRFGIPCTYARSNKLNHIWNVVCLDGRWYHLDVTHDDPLRDRAGQAQHTWFLTGAVTTAAQNNGSKNVDDIEYGAAVQVCADDHPLHTMLKDCTRPTVAVDDDFYCVVPTDGGAVLAQIFADDCAIRNIRDLPSKWRIPGESGWYVGNFSGIASDGKFVYFTDDSAVYAYDPFTDEETAVWSCPDDTVLYGLQYGGGALTALVGSTPNDLPYKAAAVGGALPEPVYYTVTWVVGDQSFTARAREGSDPFDCFNGSLEIEDENGVEYFFDRWSPELSEVTGDVTYTAIFIARLTYLPGDVDENGVLSIEDVTRLLDMLATGQAEAARAADVDRNGRVSIEDVTALLDALSAGN
ncbi:MAG: hypothetical protein IJU52_06005 [Clostridia bacterium]|nr:hypothetical protein [Clostridia bacterium]